MPFTPAHAAAVLPLMRRPFSRAALVAGAVAPDMPYFVVTTGLPVGAESWYEPLTNATISHTALGAVTVTLPYALLLWCLLLSGRRPLRSLLLRPPRAAAQPRTAGRLVRRAGWVVLSCLIGIATHLVWDAFTHHDGFFVTRTPWLDDPTAFDGLNRARVLQHVSTAGGLVTVAVYMWRRRHRLLTGAVRTARGGAGRRRLVLLATAPLLPVVGAVAGAWQLAGQEGAVQGEAALSAAAKGGGVGLFVSVALHVAAWWIVQGVRAARPAAGRAGSVHGDAAPQVNSAA